jgi:uncharacterized protein
MPYFVFRGLDRDGVAEARAQLREIHRAYIRTPSDDCRVAAGGPLFDDAGEQMIGTVLILEAQDREAALRYLAADPYASVPLFGQTELHRWHWGLGQPT